jgi:hypothetical protein
MDKIKTILSGYRPPFIYCDFQDYINHLDFTTEDVCKLTQRGDRTVRGWIANDTAPRWAYLYLYTCAGYILHDQFRGFRFLNGELFTGTRITYNRGFTSSKLTEYAFFHDLMRTISKENDQLKAQLNEVNNQPQRILKHA